MKSDQEHDTAGSKTPPGAEKAAHPDEKNTAPKKTELTDDQIATISGGIAAVSDTPPPMDLSPGN